MRLLPFLLLLLFAATSARAGELIVPEHFQSKRNQIKVLAKSKKATSAEVLKKIERGPKPGAYVAGDERLVLVGTGVKVKLLRGAAHLEVFPGEGTVTVPAGVRMRERLKGVCRWTSVKKVGEDGGEAVTMPRDARRVFYFDGRRARDGATLVQEGRGRVFVRGFCAAVELEMAEWEGRVREYRFPKMPSFLEKKQQKRRAERGRWRRLVEQGMRALVFGLI